MYRIVFAFCFFCSSTFAQNLLNLNFLEKDIDFTLNVKKTIYHVNDSIDIKFEINNVSNKNFFLFAFNSFKEEPYIDRETNEIYYIYGGHLSTHVGLVNAMRIVEPDDKISFSLLIDANTVYDKKSKLKTQSFKFYIYFGYLDFNKNLIYLSNSESNLVQVQKDEDMSDIIDLHHELILGYIPITISNNE